MAPTTLCQKHPDKCLKRRLSLPFLTTCPENCYFTVAKINFQFLHLPHCLHTRRYLLLYSTYCFTFSEVLNFTINVKRSLMAGLASLLLWDEDCVGAKYNKAKLSYSNLATIARLDWWWGLSATQRMPPVCHPNSVFLESKS